MSTLLKKILICLACLLFLAIGSVTALLLWYHQEIISKVSQPNKNLIVHNIPSILPSLHEILIQEAGTPSLTFLSWQPNHRAMLVSGRIDSRTTQLHLLQSPGGSPSPLTSDNEDITSGSIQTKKGKYLFFNRDSDGKELYEKCSLDLQTGEITPITQHPSHTIGGCWSRDGSFYAYASDSPHSTGVQIHIINQVLGMWDDAVLATCPGPGWSIRGWSPGNKWILLNHFVSDKESSLWRMDFQSGALTPILPTGKNRLVSYTAGAISEDGNGVFTFDDRDSDFQHLVYLDSITHKEIPITPKIPWDITEWDISSHDRFLAYIVNEDGRGVLHILDRKIKKELPTPSLPQNSIVSRIAWRNDSTELAFSVQTTQTRGDIYSWDVHKRQLTQWSKSQGFGTKYEPVPDAELIHWRTFDTRMLSGYLYNPPTRFHGKHPVIISIHGGPEAQARPGYIGDMAYYVSSCGIAVLYPNIRGSQGYGKRFQSLDDGVLREGAYRDIGTLLDWIKTRPDLDANRILIMGQSYGGHMALVAAYRYSDRIQATIDADGMSNLATFEAGVTEGRRLLRISEYGDPNIPAIHTFMQQTAPLSHVSEIRKPLFVIAGQNDPRVPIAESMQIARGVEGHGTTVWSLIARNEGHGYHRQSNINYKFLAIVKFVQTYLQK